MPNFEKYLKVKNSEAKRHCLYWLTAFGIQSVVNLKPSDFLQDLITKHIEGSMDLKEVQATINEHYHRLRQNGDQHSHHTFETDKVAARIVELFTTPQFELSLEGFQETHHHLFHGLYAQSGELRVHPASKKEWVLGNTSVLYPKAEEIEEHMQYLFETERHFDYTGMSRSHRLRHFCDFISKLFIYNTFHYANSRVAFVYAMQYMLSRGYEFANDTFYREAWYFRNAIIRASYTNMHQGIYPTTQYMEMFLENLFFDTDHELRNHRMVIKGE